MDHLDKLEAQAIYIFREVVEEIENPVLLYSIGKDSSVLLHMLKKRFIRKKSHFHYCILIQLGNLKK